MKIEEKTCKTCFWVEDMSNTITGKFSGFCNLHQSYIRWSCCTQYKSDKTELLNEVNE